jgi:hypothetical protein
MMDFLKTTVNDGLTLRANLNIIDNWYLDAAFAVHSDFKSHTGSCMTLGQGAIMAISTKQKINTRSSTKAEFMSTDYIIAKVIWTKRFIEAQGYTVDENIIHRDNQSTMKLEQNGKASSGKCTHHFNIKFFYITDLIKCQEVSIKYCPMDQMIADYMTKPLTGQKSFVPQNHHESSLRSHYILSYLYSLNILIHCPQECDGKYLAYVMIPDNRVKNTCHEKRILLFRNNLRRTLYINSYPFYSLVLSKRS